MATAEVTAETLHTARLDLVPLDLATCQALLHGDRETAAILLDADLGTWPSGPELEVGLPRLSRRLRHDPAELPWQSRAVVVRLYRAVAGSVNLKGPPVDGRVEVGWELQPAYRGRGYAREAARAVLARAFGAAAVVEVVAMIDPTNAASIAVAEAVGMQRTDEASTAHPGAFVWRITRAAFEALA